MKKQRIFDYGDPIYRRQMNKIESALDKSEYNIEFDFLNYKIDGYWLDEKLDGIFPDKLFRGLIPTLVEWMMREDEKQVVWNRILPREDEVSVCPILMCPDDCDFSCILIVAEIQNYGPFVQWNKLGIDETREWDAEKVGSRVRWFENLGPFNFEIKEYQKMLAVFRAEIKNSGL